MASTYKYKVRRFENTNLIIHHRFEAYNHWHEIIFPRNCLSIISSARKDNITNYRAKLDKLLAKSRELYDTQMTENIYAKHTAVLPLSSLPSPSILTKGRRVAATPIEQKSEEDPSEKMDAQETLLVENDDALGGYATSVSDIDTAGTDVFYFVFTIAGKYRAFANTLNGMFAMLQYHWHFGLWGLLPADLTRITHKLAHISGNFFMLPDMEKKKELACDALHIWFKLRIAIRRHLLLIHRQIIPAFVFYDMTLVKAYVALLLDDPEAPIELAMTTKSAQSILNVA